MVDGVLTSSLERTLCILFFGMQALPKNRGHVLTPGFGKIQSERVFSMKSFTSPSGTTLMFRLSLFDSILGAKIIFRVAEFNILSGFWPIMPSRRPRMKEYSKGIVFVSSKQ